MLFSILLEMIDYNFFTCIYSAWTLLIKGRFLFKMLFGCIGFNP